MKRSLKTVLLLFIFGVLGAAPGRGHRGDYATIA
jgi:hypothetical protein